MKIIIVCNGGLVQNVVASEPVEVMLIDYDTEGACEGDTVLMPQKNGGVSEAYVSGYWTELNAEEAERCFNFLNSMDYSTT